MISENWKIINFKYKKENFFFKNERMGILKNYFKFKK